MTERLSAVTTGRVTPHGSDRLDHAVTHSAVTLAPAVRGNLKSDCIEPGGYGRLVPVQRCVGWLRQWCRLVAGLNLSRQ